MKNNLIDKVVGYFSPQAGLKRSQARYVENKLQTILKRKYDGAATGRRTDGWFTTSSSQDAAARGQLSLLRDRSRDLVRNDPYAKRAISVIETNIVGTGILAKVMDKSSSRAKKIQDAWMEWAESTQCDVSGKLNFYAMQALVARGVAESGEMLIRKVITREKQTIPLKLQILEPDLIDTNIDGLKADKANPENYVTQGIEYDKYGKPIAYYMFQQHPGDNKINLRNSLKSIRIPADEIIHVYRMDRAGQSRGIPWMHAVILNLQDLDEYIDATIVKQKVAAAFAAFVKDIEGGDIDGGTAAISEKIEPGAIEILPGGKDISFPNPPTNSDFDPFVKKILHGIATGFDISYEALTNDYSNVNFSSGRMGHIEFSRAVDKWRWHTFIPQMCDGVWDWFIQSYKIAGIDSSDVKVVWTPPRREMIDPTKEFNALKDAARNGFTSVSEIIRSLGDDPETVYKQIAEDYKKFDDLGLKFDSDPRKTTDFGMFQPVANLTVKDQKDVAEDPEDDEDSERYFKDEKGTLWRQNKNGFERVSG